MVPNKEIGNTFFIVVFALEMVIKMYSLGLQGYLVSLFNRLLQLRINRFIFNEIAHAHSMFTPSLPHTQPKLTPP